jgi:thiol-disulfide isomerase/thioredoxin
LHHPDLSVLEHCGARISLTFVFTNPPSLLTYSKSLTYIHLPHHRISTFYTHILLLLLFYSSFSNKHKPALATTATISFLRSFFTRAPSPATMSATKTKVQSIIDENPVAVFSKSYCPYCRQAKELLSQSGAKFFAIELDQVGM